MRVIGLIVLLIALSLPANATDVLLTWDHNGDAPYTLQALSKGVVIREITSDKTSAVFKVDGRYCIEYRIRSKSSDWSESIKRKSNSVIPCIN
jgi:hypothetical protein